MKTHRRKKIFFLFILSTITIIVLFNLIVNPYLYHVFNNAGNKQGGSGTSVNNSVVPSAPAIINVSGFISQYPKFGIRHLKHIPLKGGVVLYGFAASPKSNSYMPAPLMDNPVLYLPDKYMINTPRKLVRAVDNLLERMGINVSKRFNYYIRLMLVRINWSSYGFNDNSTVDYIWYVKLDLYTGRQYTPSNSYFFLSAGFSALTGAVIHLSLVPSDFYEVLDKYPDLIVNRTWFNYIIEQHKFNNSREAYRFFMDIFKLLNIDLEIYGHNFTFYFNINYPAYITVIFQAIDGKPIINTGPNTYMIGLFNSVKLSYHKDIKTSKIRLDSIFVSLLPIKYVKVIKHVGSIDTEGIIRYGELYIRQKFNLSNSIPITYLKSDRVFYLIAPWVLKEFVSVGYRVEAGDLIAIILVIDPSSMEVYDYVVLPHTIYG